MQTHVNTWCVQNKHGDHKFIFIFPAHFVRAATDHRNMLLVNRPRPVHSDNSINTVSPTASAFIGRNAKDEKFGTIS